MRDVHTIMKSAGKTAAITGVTGQDGAALTAFLLDKGYEVHGLRLYSAMDDTDRIRDVLSRPRFHLHYADLTDGGNLQRLLGTIKPHELYNLGAMSHVQTSFDVPEAAANINGLGTLRLLEAIRHAGLTETIRFYQASSSEMFGASPPSQNENTPFQPCSPYAAAKLYAFWMTRTYREAYGIHASNGILFNHEGPARGTEFVSRKISLAVAAIEAGRQNKLFLGNLDAKRDWGHVHDYVRGMWMMLQQDKPDDFVLATGQTHSVRDFVNAAFAQIGIDIMWQGEGLDEKGMDSKTGRTLIEIDPALYRPCEVHSLCGDASKARQVLGWAPQISFGKLVAEMVARDRQSITAGGHDRGSRVDAA